jgi:hypothetical protein
MFVEQEQDRILENIPIKGISFLQQWLLGV